MESDYKEILLDGNWDFTYRKDEKREVPDIPDEEEFEIIMPVPAYWCQLAN